MSSILKALKKLEDEKASRSASAADRNGGQFVAPMVSRRLPLLLLVFGIGAGLLLAGGLFILFGGRIETTQAKPLTPAPAPVATPATVVASPAAVKPASTATEPAPTSPQGKAVTVTGEQRPPVAKHPKPSVKSPVIPIVPTAVMPPAPDASHPGAVSATATSQEPMDQVRVEPREIPSPGQQWTAPNLTVSDILPASGDGRMAIVNGLPVMEGTMVEDAVVREIRPEQVIFEVDGKSVAVPLSSSR